MKKKDIYEIGFKFFGLYFFAKAIIMLLGSILVLKTISSFIPGVNSSAFSLFLVLIGYLSLGYLFFFKTNLLLKLLNVDESTETQGMLKKTIYHLLVIALGGLLFVNSIPGVVKHSYKETRNGIVEKQEYLSSTRQIEITYGDIPKSWSNETNKGVDYGSIVGIFLGLTIIACSKGIAKLLLVEEEKIGK
jgi:hypothetical protein